MFGQLAAAEVVSDPKTEAAMTVVWELDKAMERLRAEQYGEISRHYKSIAASGGYVFATKWADRHYRLKEGFFGSREIGYYKRIVRIVSTMIMPKAVAVALLMVEYPGEALMWGSYLYYVFSEVKLLCQLFESVCTNGKVSFRGIDFLRFNDEFALLFSLTKLGDVDWKQMWDDLCEVATVPDREEFREILDDLLGVAKGDVLGEVNVAAGGIRDIFSHPQDYFNTDSILGLLDTFEDLKAAINLLDHPAEVGNRIKELVSDLSPEEALAQLLAIDAYDINDFIMMYVNEDAGRFYRQRYYIAQNFREVDYPVMYSADGDVSQMFCVPTTDPDYLPSTTDRQAAKQNSESICGWSKAYCNQLNAQDPDVQYSISYVMRSYVIKEGGRQTAKGYTYDITVKRTVTHHEEVYEEVFDSQEMQLASFLAMLNAKLDAMNAEEGDAKYQIGHDEKIYYSVPSEERLASSDRVEFVVNCHDNNLMSQGSNRWREDSRDVKSSLKPEFRERFAMATRVSESDQQEMEELNSMLTDAKDEYDRINSDLSDARDRETTLYGNLGASTSLTDSATVAGWRNELAAIQAEIRSLEAALSQQSSLISQINDAKQELQDDMNEVEEDNYWRIPHFMAEIEQKLGVTWTDPGGWSGYTYIRHGTYGNNHVPVTFTCDFSMVKAAKYILGVRVHRARLLLSWKLTGDFSSSNVVEVMELKDMSPEEKEQAVSQRMREIQAEYPECGVEVQYVSEGGGTDDLDDDAPHLLWMSDRIAIAQEVEYRLRSLYSQLDLIHKFASGRHSIAWVLKHRAEVALHHSLSAGQRDEFKRQWLENARRTKVTPGQHMVDQENRQR